MLTTADECVQMHGVCGLDVGVLSGPLCAWTLQAEGDRRRDPSQPPPEQQQSQREPARLCRYFASSHHQFAVLLPRAQAHRADTLHRSPTLVVDSARLAAAATAVPTASARRGELLFTLATETPGRRASRLGRAV